MQNNEIEDLQKNLASLYFKNMKLLENKFPVLFEKITLLSNELEEKERYSLELKDEGYFDIYDNEENSFIYGFNSYLEADLRAKKTDFSTQNSINLLRMDSNTNKFALVKPLENNVHLVDYLNQKIDFNNIEFDRIYKFIFIGTGVGVHISEIDKKIKPMNTLIIEPNLEIFRLSLFLTDLEIFTKGNRTLFLSIAESKNELFETLSNFSHNHSYMNHTIKHHLFKYEYKYLLDDIIEFYSINDPSGFPYSSILNVTARTLNFMKQGYPFLKKDLLDRYKPLENKNVLVISAGPSVDNHIDLIKKHRNKFVIICVDVILRKLEKNGIKPDIVVSIDPYESCARYLMTDDEDFLNESSIILLSQQHPTTMKIIENKNFFFSQVYPIADELGYSLSLPNVGTFSFFIANLLGANKIYLTGCDAAFNQETGSRYANDSSHIRGHHAFIRSDENLISRDDVIQVKGNLQDTVKTTRELLEFKASYEELIHLLNLKGNYYNLSNGAYINGLKPFDINKLDFDKLEKQKFDKNILKESSTTIDMSNSSSDINTINNIIKKVKKFSKTKFKNKNDFMQQKIDLTIWILKEKKKLEISIISTIFIKFLEYIDTYVNFTFNLKQKEIYTKDFFNKITFYWSNSIIELLESTKKALNDPTYGNEDNIYNKINEFKFEMNLSAVNNIETFKDSPVKAIGFMYSKENLSDHDFMKFIEEILTRFPHVKIKALSINEDNKRIHPNIEIVKINSIEDISKEVMILVATQNTTLEKKLNKLYFSNICAIIPFSKYPSIKKVKDFNSNAVIEIIKHNYDIFGLTQSDIEKYPNHLLLRALIVSKSLNERLPDELLDLNLTISEHHLELIDLILKNKDFISSLNNFRKNIQKFL